MRDASSRRTASAVTTALMAALLLAMPTPAEAVPASPTISTITPAYGPVEGGTTIVITGTNFDTSTKVEFEGQFQWGPLYAARSVTFDSSTQITAVSRTHYDRNGGPVTVYVTNSPGANFVSDSRTAGFWYTSVFPAAGRAAGGDTVKIRGPGIDSATSVTFGGAPATITDTRTADEVQVLTPAGTPGGAVDVVISTPSFTDTRTASYTYFGTRTFESALSLADSGANTPMTLALSPNGKRMYVGTWGTGIVDSTFLSINLATETPTVVDTLTVGPGLNALQHANAGSTVYALSRAEDQILKLSETNTGWLISDTRTVTGTDGLAVSADGGTWYAGINDDRFELLAINSTSRAVETSLALGYAPENMALHPNGQYLYTLHPFDGRVSVIDVSSTGLSVSRVLNVGAKPQDIAFTPDESRALVTNYDSGSLSIIALDQDGLPETPTSVATVSHMPYAHSVAVTPDGRFAYVTNGRDNVVWQIDITTAQIVDVLGVSGSAPHVGRYTLVGAAASPDGSYTYVIHYSNDTVLALRNPPSITSVWPQISPTAGGASVTITGFGFDSATAVTFGGVAAASFRVDSATQITAITPVGTAGAVSIVIAGPVGSFTKTAAFTYVAPTSPSTPAPVAALAGPVASLTSITPSTGPTSGGTLVTIAGSNLGSVTGVTFNGNAATSLTVVDSTRITAVAPAGVAGPANVMLSMPGSTASFGAVFTYVAPTPPTTDTGTSSSSTTSSGTATTGGSTTTSAVRAGAALATFATKSSLLSAADRKTIQRLVTASGMDARYRIKGYGSSNASAQTLARARARAIQRLLIELGVAYSRISTEFNSKVARQVQLVALTDR